MPTPNVSLIKPWARPPGVHRGVAMVCGLLAALSGGCFATDGPPDASHTTEGPSATTGGPSRAPSGAPLKGPDHDTRVGLVGCPEGPLYTVAPLAASDFRAIRALGWHSVPIWTLGGKHSSWSINLPGENRTGVPVAFPSDATVTSISRSTFTQPGKDTPSVGHGLDFYPCRDVRNFLGHLGPISEKLAAAFEASTPTCRTQEHGLGQMSSCTAKVKVAVTAGEAAGENDGTGGVDFGMIDYRRGPHAFANLSRYSFDHAYYASPIPLYASPLKQELMARFGSWDGKVQRTDEPVEGTFVYDVAATLAGNWFPPGKDLFNTEDHSPFLSFAHEYVDNDVPIIALGNSLAGVSSPMLLSFTTKSIGDVNRAFRDVTPDGTTYCFDEWTTGPTAGGVAIGRLDGVLVAAMPDAESLRLEKQGTQGSTCESLRPWALTASATRYER